MKKTHESGVGTRVQKRVDALLAAGGSAAEVIPIILQVIPTILQSTLVQQEKSPAT